MIALNLFRRDEYKSQWLKELSIFWIVVAYPICGTINTQFLQCKVILHRRIEDIALQKWNTDVSTSSMCRMYRLFKKQLDFENYLLHSN